MLAVNSICRRVRNQQTSFYIRSTRADSTTLTDHATKKQQRLLGKYYFHAETGGDSIFGRKNLEESNLNLKLRLITSE